MGSDGLWPYKTYDKDEQTYIHKKCHYFLFGILNMAAAYKIPNFGHILTFQQNCAIRKAIFCFRLQGEMKEFNIMTKVQNGNEQLT
jgi:hypothetical protein